MGYREYLLTLAASVILSVVLGVFFWRRRPSPGAAAMAALSGMVLVWASGYLLERLSTSLSGFRIANSIEYIGIVSIPALWFVFTVQYARYDNWITRRIYLLFIIPAISLVLVWTNFLHGWMWYDSHLRSFREFLIQFKTYGHWFGVHSAYSYLLALWGIIILGMRLFNPGKLYRKQVIILLIGVILPLIWNIIFVLKAAPTYYIDMTPPAFVISGTVLALGLFRYRILDVVPIARNTVFEKMDDGVIILDRQKRIIDLNPAAEEVIGCSSAEVIGKPSGMSFAKLPELQKRIFDKNNLQTEMHIKKNNRDRFFELNVASLHDRKKNLIGHIITFHDFTERKIMEQSLKEYTNKITRVQEEERKRIAYELHDDTAQYLSILKMQIGALADSGEVRSPKFKERLLFLEKDADRAFNDVRRYSHELRPVVLEHMGLAAALEQLADDYNKLGQLSVEVNIEGMEPQLSEDVKLGLFRIAQEALNNTRKHARASQVNIGIRFIQKQVQMIVSDNGVGFNVNEALKKTGGKGSLGLMSMQERANLINADIKIESETGSGTQVILKARI